MGSMRAEAGRNTGCFLAYQAKMCKLHVNDTMAKMP